MVDSVYGSVTCAPRSGPPRVVAPSIHDAESVKNAPRWAPCHQASGADAAAVRSCSLQPCPWQGIEVLDGQKGCHRSTRTSPCRRAASKRETDRHRRLVLNTTVLDRSHLDPLLWCFGMHDGFVHMYVRWTKIKCMWNHQAGAERRSCRSPPPWARSCRCQAPGRLALAMGAAVGSRFPCFSRVVKRKTG